MILCDEHNPRAVRLHAELTAHLPEGHSVPEDLVLVLGGDGFLLRTVKRLGLGYTYLGLNAGHLGFLLNDLTDWDQVIEQLMSGRWTTHDFPLLEARATLTGGEQRVVRAINDIYLERSTGQAARLALTIDGHEVVDNLVADGLIFATALGSTAYAFSAGAQPVHPTLHTLLVTPICPHLPRLTPFALPATAKATVLVRHADWRPVRAVADGQSTEGVREVEIGFCDRSVRLAYFESHDFTLQMVRKIVHP